MVSRISLLFTLFVFVSIFSISDSATAKEIVNLVSNPDFESGVDGWSLGLGNPFTVDKKEKFAVGNVVLADIQNVGANDWEPEIHSKGFDVENGKTYTCSFWAKADAKRSIGVKFEQLDTWVGPSQNFNLSDGEMTEYFFSPVMTMGSPPQVVIHIQFNKQKGKVWFAHFRVYEGKYVEDDLAIKPKIAVSPSGNLTTTWGKIKF
jgi:hypothetical protein